MSFRMYSRAFSRISLTLDRFFISSLVSITLSRRRHATARTWRKYRCASSLVSVPTTSRKCGNGSKDRPSSFDLSLLWIVFWAVLISTRVLFLHAAGPIRAIPSLFSALFCAATAISKFLIKLRNSSRTKLSWQHTDTSAFRSRQLSRQEWSV